MKNMISQAIKRELRKFDKRHPLLKKPKGEKDEFQLAMWEITNDGILFERNKLQESLEIIAKLCVKK